MTPKDPLSNAPAWMDPAVAIAAFGSYRDMASYNKIMRGEPGVFDSSADFAYGYLPDGNIYTDGNPGSRLIDHSYNGGRSFDTGSRIGASSSGRAYGAGDYQIFNSSSGHYVFEAAPKASSEAPADNSEGQNQNQSYTYSSFNFTFDSLGNPSFTGPTDTEHPDGKWKIQEIAAKLSDGDYTKFKKTINEERKKKGFEDDYYKDVS